MMKLYIYEKSVKLFLTFNAKCKNSNTYSVFAFQLISPNPKKLGQINHIFSFYFIMYKYTQNKNQNSSIFFYNYIDILVFLAIKKEKKV